MVECMLGLKRRYAIGALCAVALLLAAVFLVGDTFADEESYYGEGLYEVVPAEWHAEWEPALAAI